jgi:hypothetical protein
VVAVGSPLVAVVVAAAVVAVGSPLVVVVVAAAVVGSPLAAVAYCCRRRQSGSATR